MQESAKVANILRAMGIALFEKAYGLLQREKRIGCWFN